MRGVFPTASTKLSYTGGGLEMTFFSDMVFLFFFLVWEEEGGGGVVGK